MPLTQPLHKPEVTLKRKTEVECQAIPPQLAASMTNVRAAKATNAIFLGSILNVAFLWVSLEMCRGSKRKVHTSNYNNF